MNSKTREYLIEKLKSGEIGYNSTTKVTSLNGKETLVDQEGKTYKISYCFYDYNSSQSDLQHALEKVKKKIPKDSTTIQYQKNKFKVFVSLKEIENKL